MNYVNNKMFHELLIEYGKLHVKCPNEECKQKIKLIKNECPLCGSKVTQIIKDKPGIILYEKKLKKLYNKIGASFLLIAKNLLNKSNFINYTEDRKDEMISDATYFMCNYIDRYDVDRGNPFSYFTRVAFNSFIQNINDYTARDKMFHSLEYIDNFSNDDCFDYNNRKIENE